MKKIISGLALIVALGCSNPSNHPNTNLKSSLNPQSNTSSNQISNPKPSPIYNAPTVSYSGKEAVENIDPKTFVDRPDGYFLDLNGDGITDQTFMSNGNDLVFKKGKGDNKFDEGVVILNIKGYVRGYKIDIYKDEKRPCLFIYNEKGDGFLQRNLGNNDQGIHYFGELERVE